MISDTLTEKQIEAIGYVLDLAYEDQEQDIKYSDFSADYSDDLEWIIEVKKDMFTQIGEFAEAIGFHGEKERWTSLIEEFQGVL